MSPPVSTTRSLGTPSASATAARKPSSSVTRNRPSVAPGRRLIARTLPITWGYTVTVSRSSIVNTVSRCMCARSLVITAAITRSAAPVVNRARAICSIILAWDRSLSPLSTVPYPIGCTSPPSSQERPKSSTWKRPSSPSCGYQYSKSASANIGWAR